jgi:polyferredoxin
MRVERPNWSLGIISLGTALISGLLVFRFWSAGETAFALSFFWLGISLGPCLAGYSLVPKKGKQWARRLVLIAGGLSILCMSLAGTMMVDLEGFFMLLLLGTMGAAIGHTLITLILGPMLMGRFLCGWGCWRAMVLELLPVGKGSGRRGGIWSSLPWIGLGVSLGGAAFSLLVLGHHPGGTLTKMHGGDVVPVAAGFFIYYAASICLGLVLRDQRAFCKYFCPSALLLRGTSRLSLVKMSARSNACHQCGICSQVCPMDIDVAQYVKLGKRVTSGECILCQRCAHACPQEVLGLTVGFDVGRRNPSLLIFPGVNRHHR